MKNEPNAHLFFRPQHFECHFYNKFIQFPYGKIHRQNGAVFFLLVAEFRFNIHLNIIFEMWNRSIKMVFIAELRALVKPNNDLNIYYIFQF